MLETVHQDGSLFILYATAIDPEVIPALVAVTGDQILELSADDLPDAEDTSLTPEVQLLNIPPGNGEDVDLEDDLIDGNEDEPVQRDSSAAASVADDHAVTTEQPQPHPAPAPRSAGTPVKETSLRVNVELLDDLMTFAGELVLTRNQLMQEVAARDTQGVEASTHRLDQVTTELQEAIVSTRMQPVGSVFSKFRRIVRDLARDLGKEVELHIEGEDVELDKTIIEALGDPLTHLVRNSMDHGIESPEKRRQLGKSLPARLALRARHEAGQVLVEVADDGAGIDVERIRAKALSSGVVEQVRLDAMSDQDALQLIFGAGFSTAETVTGMSGRGVGMDVVHTNLTNLGGVVDINTEVGAGTTIRVALPLTLAIIPSLLVELAAERFAIPQVNIVELVRVAAKHKAERIQCIGEAHVLLLRGRLLPLIYLRTILGVGGEEKATAPDGATHVAVLRAGDNHFGLVVDEVRDSREIVVKPLDKFIKECVIYAGGTILGDGSVALILDVMGLSQQLTSVEASAGLNRTEELEPETRSDSHNLLLVHNAPGEQFAVPMSLVSRIEAISRDQIEVFGGRPCMQYRGGHLILFSLSQAAETENLPKLDELFVVVFRAAGAEVGLLVSAVVDIITEAVEIAERGFRQAGVSGSTIIGGKTTLVVDLYGLVRHVDPDWMARVDAEVKGDATVLLAEDTPFFRQQMRRCLEEAGYQLLVAEDGAQAFEILQQRYADIDVVVTDVEMPHMDGLELTRAIRRDDRLRDLPVITVTSLSDDDDRQRGLDAGVDEYLLKLDQEQLLQTVRRFVEASP